MKVISTSLPYTRATQALSGFPANLNAIRIILLLAFGFLLSFAAASAQTPPSQTITYTSFSKQTYQLRAFSGRYVQIALPDSWLAPDTGLDSAQITAFVSSTDLLYGQMSALVAAEPAGDGLLRIAVVDVGTGGEGGIGYIGAKGVEISNSASMLSEVRAQLARNSISEVLTHEMAHNFDVYNAYLSYYPEGVHAWTGFLIHYFREFPPTGIAPVLPDDQSTQIDSSIRLLLGSWYTVIPPATWSNCVRTGGGCQAQGIIAPSEWAALMLEYTKRHGRAAVQQAMRAISNLKASSTTLPATPEDKQDVLVDVLATGANTNIVCEMDAWHWPVSAAKRAELAQKYPSQNPYCGSSTGEGTLTEAVGVYALPLRSASSPTGRLLSAGALARAVVPLPGVELIDSFAARPDAQGNWPTSLNNLTLTVGGKLTRIVAVTRVTSATTTPTYRIDFAVPIDATGGIHIPLVVTYAPTNSSWTSLVSVGTMPLACFWGVNGTPTGDALAQDADTFVAINASHPAGAGARVMLFGNATYGLLYYNILKVHARRLSDNTDFLLQVENAGYPSATQFFPGIDQIIVRIPTALSGAGRVEVYIEGSSEGPVYLYL